MKPIGLELSGLQSYREKQYVDFDKLCEGGIFGIFGPTGSGKSSILDAMTLALYGKVERAAKGTQGIMNGAENKLTVAFTFELSDSKETMRYRVERQYKRAGDVSVHGAICRLVQVKLEGDIVLADKQSDVDAEIERLIGLGMPDFTRAVVLPQGKFAEFLTLAGKDRRQMLQRLFRLERYGDVLSGRLSRRADAVKLSLKETEAEQLGLGDASPEALAEAETRLAAAREAANLLKLRLAAAEAAHTELTRRRELHTQLERIERELAAHRLRSDEMKEKERRLHLLEQAQAVAPFLSDVEDADQELAAGRIAKAEAEAELARRAAEAAEAAADWLARAAEAERTEPELLVKLERLEQAIRLEGELADWARQSTELASSLEEAAADKRSADASAAVSSDKLARARTKQSAIKEQLDRTAPLAEASSRLQTASSRKERLDALMREARESGVETATAKEQELRAADRLRRADEFVLAAAAEGAQLRYWWKKADEELAAVQQRIHRWATELQNEEERQRAEERDHERRHLARLLTERLVDGQPCPVCGSSDHSGVAVHDSSKELSVDWEAMRAELSARSARLAQLKRETDGWRTKSEWHLARVSEAIRASVSASASPKEDIELGREDESSFIRLAERYDDPSFSQALSEAAVGLEKADSAGFDIVWREWSRFDSQLIENADRTSMWESDWSGANRERAQAAEAHAGALQAAAIAETKSNRRSEEANAFLTAWSAEFPDLRLESVEDEAAAAARSEAETKELRERLATSVGFIEEQEAKLKELERRSTEMAIRQAELNARLQNVEASRLSVSERLREWTGGQSAGQLQILARQELESLRRTAAEAKTQAEASEKRSRDAAALAAVAADREATAVSRQERAAVRLMESLSGRFDSAADAKRLIPAIPEAPFMKRELDDYKQHEAQLAGQYRLMKENAAGDPVPQNIWEASAASVDSLRTETDIALASAAKSERDSDDLKARRDRWEQLESSRVRFAADASRIAQLQSAFRGNAFVEYIAEEQLEQVCVAASERLGFLTSRRYALEVDAGGGFVIRDDANGGLKRPVSSLSGGETFLTSLALALALSVQIQLRGKYPLQFFFLDEGFGTLDPELLDTVITSLERLQHSLLSVGVISHVPELQARLPRKLHVTPAEPGGRGSRITFESM
ncbi:AAA family ATPase [Cohnella faecalis]|uniref:Nuclease SbcCD subunit C n=1 Tax=Cohnella faecalis TaxID=2315694 RepID=A0A398CNW5_9BACL|nr:SMC family ATPase [Cohnella faecalis]RIE04195.1 SMC family ATPase [Cohnella faecalis]